MQISLPDHWNLNEIMTQLDEFGFCIIDHAYSNEYLTQVRDECLSHLDKFKNAAIQNGVMSTVRSDHILWIDDQLELACQHTHILNMLGQNLNEYFYLGIKEVEAHFACYEAGEFYALHRDNPQQKNNRVISSVFYLHEQWQASFGGELKLQDKQQCWHVIDPKPNRIALFQSDLLHEVLLSHHQRLSITAWLRTQSSIW